MREIMKSYKWGILGAGGIAGKFAEGLKLCDNAVLWSVGSRDLQKAQKFASTHGFKHSFGSYEDFVSDPELDIVYVATPHSHHHRHTLLSLNHGKHVLCEKAFALNLTEVEEMIKTAREKKLFLMEALWPPFQPSYREADRIIRSGEMGSIIEMSGRFGFISGYDSEARTYNLALGGGSLLDVGVYPLMDILRYMGMPAEVTAISAFAPTGADESTLAVLSFEGELKATAYCSFVEDAGVGTTFVFEKGRLLLERNREKVQILTIEREGNEAVVHKFKPEASGFQFEAEEVMSCLDAGKTESEVVPLQFSYNLMKLLDTIRSITGLEYPRR
jgi:predicted dehydrogenase